VEILFDNEQSRQLVELLLARYSLIIVKSLGPNYLSNSINWFKIKQNRT
jgi:hypothetical protein